MGRHVAQSVERRTLEAESGDRNPGWAPGGGVGFRLTSPNQPRPHYWQTGYPQFPGKGLIVNIVLTKCRQPVQQQMDSRIWIMLTLQDRKNVLTARGGSKHYKKYKENTIGLRKEVGFKQEFPLRVLPLSGLHSP